MKRVVILYEEINEKILRENVSILKELWQKDKYEVVELVISENISSDEYMNKLVSLREDFLITFAMAGFGWRGWMEQVRFNTLAVMQIHILIGHLSFYDNFLQMEYGIQHFFFTDNREIFEGWKEKYPQIPYMGSVPTLYVAEHLSEKEINVNRTNFQHMLYQVFSFIEKPSVL